MSTAALTLDDLVISRLEPGERDVSVSALAEAMLQEQRLAGRTLKQVANKIPRHVVAQAIEVNLTNLSKLYQRKHLSRVQSEDISDLTSLWKEMSDVFMHDDEVMNEWLNSKIAALNGRAPVELMETMPGRKALREILNRLRYGDFS